MEYLMTYGWAILIVIVVGAVLVYYGVFKPPISKTTSGFGSIAVIDQDYSATLGTLRLYIENRAGDAVTINAVSVTYSTGVQTNCTGLISSTGVYTVPMAGRTWLTCTGEADIAGAMYTPTVIVTYTKAGQSLSSTGTVSGQRS